MKDRDGKFMQIEKAAYELLQEKGYESTSMLSIAKRAGTSNQTLYRWYGDKRGLFGEMVKSNATQARNLLNEAIRQDKSVEQCFEELGPVLLGMLTGPRAVALNRAAAADHTGQLGEALAAFGREDLFPLFRNLMQRFVSSENLSGHWLPEELAELYINLLVGDWQIRCVTGAMPRPDAAQIISRSGKALSAFRSIALSSC